MPESQVAARFPPELADLLETLRRHEDLTTAEAAGAMARIMDGEAQPSHMAALLMAAGTKGKRFSLPHSRMMIHQPIGGFQGQATDIEIHAREILNLKDTLNNILANHTGQPLDRIKADTDRDFFMSGEDAKTYGLIDEVIAKKQTRATKEK